MNWLLFISGLFALLAVIDHFVMSEKSFLKPMLNASFDDIPKKVMYSVFHFISIFLVLSAAVLLALGLGYKCNGDFSLLVRFIAINYLLFAISQIIIALTSKIDKAIFKLFQWAFFILIAVFAWIGVA